MSTLEILSPADSVGLAFGERETLAVRYLGPSGTPTAGTHVAFAIVADLPAETAAGATLSQATADTDAAGRASVDVVAGAAKGSFRVRAEVTGTPIVYFTITVSDQGFADLEVRLLRSGNAALGTVEVRLYRGTVRCADLAPESLPQGPFPVRVLGDAGAAAHYAALASDEAYALIATGGGDGHVTAEGCIDLAPRMLRPAGLVIATVPLVDRPVQPAATYDLTSTFDLSPLRQLITAPGEVWARADCTLGAAQLVLDCAIDALDGGDPADCRVEDPGPAATLLQAARGPVDAEGCRPALAGSAASLDAILMPVLSADGAPAGRLAAAARTLSDLLDALGLDMTLQVAPATAILRLAQATLEAGGVRQELDLRTTALPLIVAVAPAARSLPGDDLILATLPFTLRLGDLVDAAFSDATSLPGKGGGLGVALVAQTGCNVVSSLMCPPAGLPSDCLRLACAAGTPVLDDALAEPFTLLSGEAVDFIIEGSAVLSDGDGDLSAEQLRNGSWDATARLADGSEIPLFGVFQGTAR